MFLLFSMLISCESSKTPNQTTQSATTSSPIATESLTDTELTTVTQSPSDSVVSVPVIAGGVSEYTIIYPNQTTSVLRSAVFDFFDDIKQRTGAALKISHDQANVTWTHEIVIGNCDRPEVAEIKSKLRFMYFS